MGGPFRLVIRDSDLIRHSDLEFRHSHFAAQKEMAGMTLGQSQPVEFR